MTGDRIGSGSGGEADKISGGHKNMIAIGIDVSKGKSTVVAIGEGKKVIQKPYDVVHNKTELTKLIDSIKKFNDEVRVVMEHTGVYYRIVAETLHAAGIRVSVVNPVLINQFGDNTLRKVKTDKKDSMKIARYTLENREDLRDYTIADTLRDNLKSFVRQFNFENNTITAHKNSLGALLERVFPAVDAFFSFSNPAKVNGHLKIVDFVIEFWHNDCVSLLSEVKFIEKYKKFCKKNRYIFDEATAKAIHAKSRENLTTMPKNDTTKILTQGSAKRLPFSLSEKSVMFVDLRPNAHLRRLSALTPIKMIQARKFQSAVKYQEAAMLCCVRLFIK